MSDFRNYLKEQQQDPVFRRAWEARTAMMLRKGACIENLYDANLTNEELERIEYLVEHPEEAEAILQEYAQDDDSEDDALLAAFVARAAEVEGAQLLAEYEAAKARGEVPEIPEELDLKCRDLIRKCFGGAQ